MSRIPLNHGDTIQLNNRQYTIDSVIGDGATCIVYSAYYTDNMGLPHRVNIKECYPYNANITRNGQKLYWDSEEEKSKSIVAFCNAYEKLMVCQNGNFTVHAFDICEANQTQYIVMDANSGVTFDKDTSASLSDILKTVRLLAYVIDNYHKNGYLHLDIKPSNFLVYPRPSEHIVLFDMDTVTLIDDISSGKIKCVSYSDGWAAPEQKQGKISKLCPATDIYAIGAVLFEKIMDRPVDAADMGIFADWDFDGELFEEVNPKIKRLLRGIFRKTLSANIKRRYQSASELIKDLTETIKIADSNVFLKGDDICCSGCFFGRQNELTLIKTFFASEKKAVFLHGFGGIGKTEIARRYAQLNSNHYDTVLFVKYNKNETLQDLLNEIEIVNFDTDDSKERWRKLRTLLDEHTLVIVDNFDIEIGTDNGLKALFETKANILVATRTDFRNIYSGDKYAYVEVKELATDDLQQVFLTNAKINSITDNEREILNRIFKLIENHTYATELLAKQMSYSGWSFDVLYSKIKEGFSSLENAEKVVSHKDEHIVKDNSLNIIRAVYRISELTAEQKQVLRNMSILSFVKLKMSVYKKLTAAETLNPLNELVEIGLIQNDSGFLSLHKLVTDLIKLELNPCWDNCIEVYNYVFQQIEKFSEYEHIVYDADRDEAEHNGEFLYLFFKSNGLTLQENSKLAIRWLNKLAYMDPSLWFFLKISKHKQNKFESFLDNLEAAFAEAQNSIGVYYIRCIICLEKCEKIASNQKKYSFKDKQLEHRIISCFVTVKKMAEQITCGKEILRGLGDMIFDSVHMEHKLVPLIVVHEYYNHFSSNNHLTIQEKRFYDIPLNAKDQEEKRLYQYIQKSDFYLTRIDNESELEELIESFESTSYKYDLAQKVANDSQYNKQRKLQILNAFLDTVFEPMFRCFYKDKAAAYISQVDWTEINLIIDLISDIRSNIITPSWNERKTLKFSYDEDSYSDEYEPYWDESDDEEDIDAYLNDEEDSAYDMTIVYKTIISLIMGTNDFLALMSKVDKYSDENSSDNKNFSEGMYRIMHICYLIDKCWVIVPYMFQALMDVLPDRAKEDFLIDVRAYYPMIRQVADYAEVAKKEMVEDSQLNEKFTKINIFADNLANLIINKTFDTTANTEED